MTAFSRLAWKALAIACQPATRQFRRVLPQARETQQACLLRILRQNGRTRFGEQHRFEHLRDWDDFRSRVPLQSADEYQRLVQRVAAGEANLLNPGMPRFFGLTSGLAGEAKLIAHTPGGLSAFQRATRIWVGDLLAHWPGIARGRAYLSISPPLAACRSHAATGIPVGLSRPAGHFAAWGSAVFRQISVTSPGFDDEACWQQDISAWRYATACLLAAAPDLSFVSLANPGFFDVLWQTLNEQTERVLADVRDGFAFPGHPPVRGSPQRARHLARCLAAGAGPQDCWPELGLISCWAHAASRFPAGVLARQFPAATLQAKGLWATEAPVTIPLHDFAWPVLAIDCACYEFLDAAGNSRLAHELDEGGEYEVVLTTPGGLYRYQLGDVVRVRGFAGTTPQLELLGRSGLVSDLAGEKLAESFVARCLPEDGGSLLLPAVEQRRYLLVVDAARYPAEMAEQQAAAVEQALCRHWLYADRRQLGLLEPVRALRVRAPAAIVDRLFLAGGMRGDGGKPVALAPSGKWLAAFAEAAEA